MEIADKSIIPEEEKNEMMDERSWEEFTSKGMLWFVNRILHVFGWAIVVELRGSVVTRVFPARVRYRGFTEDIDTRGFANVSEYMKENAETLLQESIFG